ncbi:MAG: hypothetical protein Fues2KO_22070 [Fuerstiella sp.]
MLLIIAGPLPADVIVDVQDALITADGTGFVNVLISSNANPSSPDDVDFASYEFLIENVGTPSSALEFVLPPDLSEDSDSDYLFFGDSFGIDYDSFNSTTATYIGSDGTGSGTGVSLDSSSGDRLLVRLDLQHTLGPGQSAAMAVGEQFRITLQNSLDTYFDDPSFNPISVDADSYNSSGTGGGLITVSASSSAAVPEPSSWAVLALGGIALAVRRRRSGSASVGRQ